MGGCTEKIRSYRHRESVESDLLLTCIFSFSKLAKELMLLIEFCVMTLCESRSLAIISLLLTRYAGNGAIEGRRRNLVLTDTHGHTVKGDDRESFLV